MKWYSYFHIMSFRQKSIRLCLTLVVLTLIYWLLPSIYSYFSNQSRFIHNYKLEIMNKLNLTNNMKKQTCRMICRAISSVPNSKFPSSTSNTSELTNYASLKPRDNKFSHSLLGGSWMFKEQNLFRRSDEQCNSSPESGVVIIFVCTNRWQQLTITLLNLIPILQKQRLCYRIFVIEQAESGLLNKAKLMNVGFMEAMKHFQFECIVFHDTDLAPLNDQIPYGCDEQTFITPVHLGVALDIRNYTLLYPTLIGGVLKISNNHFLTVNGYSNSYWSWGQEDDDMEKRLTSFNIKYIHINESIGRYRAIPHTQQSHTKVPEHVILLNSAVSRIPYDGLNSLQYRVISTINKSLFTHILVSVGPSPYT
ncbi:hypothetical protein MN116_006218 [Schistosoma mekongi]|uniref:Beta-1,4-galactosyltransferase n=1 Tax=Schistosoma mekongi TaxID=38744 RepID=A0AAE1ZB60_SCHME|nr:hypothetical protein MN116_006218 [Schistosoma mekongi]